VVAAVPSEIILLIWHGWNYPIEKKAWRFYAVINQKREKLAR